jgi:hypothetical protein
VTARPERGGGPSAPLATKLGVGQETTLALLGGPPGLRLELPPGVVVRHRSGGHADVVLAFFVQHERLAARVDQLGSMVFPAGGLWIAWPKRSSGRATDITDHAVRELALSRGMVDNKVCAVDDTWTALRLVWRRENRATERQ